MLLFSERTWKHHGVTLVLPFGVLSYYLATAAVNRPIRTYLIGTLVAVQVALATTSTGLLPEEWAKLAQVYGAYTWGFLLLATALVVVLRSGLKPIATATVPPPTSRFADLSAQRRVG